MFTVACLKSSHKDFNILNFIKFSSQSTAGPNLSTSRCTPETLDTSIITVYQDSGTHSLQLILNSNMRLLSITYGTTYGITLSGTLTPTKVAHFTTFVHESVVVSSFTHSLICVVYVLNLLPRLLLQTVSRALYMFSVL